MRMQDALHKQQDQSHFSIGHVPFTEESARGKRRCSVLCCEVEHGDLAQTMTSQHV